MSLILECNNITKVYKIRGGDGNLSDEFINALNNVSFTLNEGDRLGLIGLNGSGKSTLLKIIGGYIKPNSGSIRLHKSISSLSGFDSMLHPDLNAIENSKLQLQILGFKKTEIPELIEKILAFSELKQFAYQPVKTYSSGMMLRLSFAVFSVTSPEILLLDEVFSAGDIKFQRKIDELMQNTFKKVSGIIIASHQLSEIQQYCNKCLILNKGEVKFYGNVNDAMSKYYNLNTKPEIVYLSNLVKIKDVKINSTSIKTSEPIKITIKVEKNDSNIDIFPSIYITNYSGKILTDSPIYNNNFVLERILQNEYEYEIEIPPNILNQGAYDISIYLGNIKNELYVTMINQFNVKIDIDDWERDETWQIPTDYPIRTRLKWTINL